MRRIGLISDTHGYLDNQIKRLLGEVDEIWHAGDIGDPSVTDQLAEIKPLRAVYGNIDGEKLRTQFPLDNRFSCEEADVWITHIAGYPGKYNQRVRQILQVNPPDLMICGHSHILKVMPDKKYRHLHMNPGAAGRHGFHKVRTLLRFTVEGKNFSDLEVVELGPRSSDPVQGTH